MSSVCLYVRMSTAVWDWLAECHYKSSLLIRSKDVLTTKTLIIRLLMLQQFTVRSARFACVCYDDISIYNDDVINRNDDLL